MPIVFNFPSDIVLGWWQDRAQANTDFDWFVYESVWRHFVT